MAYNRVEGLGGGSQGHKIINRVEDNSVGKNVNVVSPIDEKVKRREFRVKNQYVEQRCIAMLTIGE